MPERVVVKAPATSANLGPGFDCLGLALDIWNTVRVQVGRSGFDVVGEGAESLERGPANLVYRSFRLAFDEAGRPVPEVSIACENEIPLQRGLGSSSAAAVAGLVAGNELCGRPLPTQRLLELAAGLEGHADNAAATILGGCQVVVSEAGRLVTAPVPLPADLRAVAFVPDLPIPTRQARAVLPRRVALEDAVYNVGRAALLVAVLAAGDTTHLRVATGDRLHQPARQALFPAMEAIFRGALDAGALGVFLSGAGSTVLALTRSDATDIGRAMAAAAAQAGVGGRVRSMRPSLRGAHVAELG